MDLNLKMIENKYIVESWLDLQTLGVFCVLEDDGIILNGYRDLHGIYYQHGMFCESGVVHQ